LFQNPTNGNPKAVWIGFDPYVCPHGPQSKIIVCLATSADGFIARTDGSVDWLDRPVPKGNYGMDVFYKSIDNDPLG